MSHFNRVLEVDHATYRVKVEAGMVLEPLIEALYAAGLSLPNEGTIDRQTIAGAVATATHGTGKTGTMSSFVVGVELITAKGEFLTINENSHLLPAARMALGSLGIVYSLTLQCEPSFATVDAYAYTNLASILQTYPLYLEANDYFKFLWNPYTDNVTIYTSNKVPPNEGERMFVEIRELEEDASLQDDMPNQVKRWEEEIAVPNRHLAAALLDIKAYLAYYLQRGVKIHGDVKCRFVEQDEDSLLSPTSDGAKVYVSISILPSESFNTKTFFLGYEDVMLPFGGRPHWGKINFLEYDLASQLYGPDLDRFIAIRRRLDPHGTFDNAFTRRVLTPPRLAR
ncbi:4-lactone oxidase [uncultured virus]|nr:4-lactone oxidase [uncultured virus]